MMGRSEIDRLMREFYAARVRGDLEVVCRSFLADAQFKIASASKVRPVVPPIARGLNRGPQAPPGETQKAASPTASCATMSSPSPT